MEKDRLEVDSLVQDFAEIDRLAARILEDRQQVKWGPTHLTLSFF